MIASKTTKEHKPYLKTVFWAIERLNQLVAQMKNGGQGKWGQGPMPPLAAVVQPEDTQKLADWILSYRWDAVLAE